MPEENCQPNGPEGSPPPDEGEAQDGQRIDIGVDDSPGAHVSTAGRDAHTTVYNGDVFVYAGEADDPSQFMRAIRQGSKSIGRNPRLVNEAIREQKNERELEQRVAGDEAEPESAQELSDVERWFLKELSTAREKYFVIVLSLFNGLKWADFWEIYQSVLDHMGLQVKDEDKADRLFAQTDEELVAKARAQIVRKEDLAAEIIEFEKPGYAGAILELLRRKYRPRLIELLPSLGKLGENGYWEIRARAAYAVAEIGKLDFYRTRRRVLETWSQDNRAHVRAAVGYTATRLIEDGVADANVRDMLDEWADPHQHRGWKFRWAAAAAYKQIGSENPDIALEGLEQAARNEDLRVMDAVIYALVVISLSGQHLPEVLHALKSWVEHKEDTVCLTAVMAFLVLASSYVEIARQRAEGELELEEGEEFQDLLHLLHDDADLQYLVMGVMVRAFEYKLWSEAFDIFEGWTLQADGDIRLQNTVRNLITKFFAQLSSRGRDRTLRVLKRWEQKEEAPLAQMGRSARVKIMDVVSRVPVEETSEIDPRIVFGE